MRRAQLAGMACARLLVAVLAATSAGCMFQQRSTTTIHVRDPGRVAVRDESGGVLLREDGAPAEVDVPVARGWVVEQEDHSGAVPSQATMLRDADRAIALVWPYGSDTLVSQTGAISAGNAHDVDAPSLHAPELGVEIESRTVGGPCTWHSGGRSSVSGWHCPSATLRGELATPWSNVTSVRRHVEPIDHAWAPFDFVFGALLTSVGIAFIVPPHTRRSEAEDTGIGLLFGAPGVLALVNGVGILLRSPYDETWP